MKKINIPCIAFYSYRLDINYYLKPPPHAYSEYFNIISEYFLEFIKTDNCTLLALHTRCAGRIIASGINIYHTNILQTQTDTTLNYIIQVLAKELKRRVVTTLCGHPLTSSYNFVSFCIAFPVAQHYILIIYIM